MPAKKNTPAKTKGKTVATLRLDAKRKNLPTVEYESLMRQEEKSPIEVAYERRNRDLDPQFVWRGKDDQDWSNLVVPAPPLYIQEKVHPKVLIDDLLRQSKARAQATAPQIDLFVVFGEPDIEIEEVPSVPSQIRVHVKGVDIFKPQTGPLG